MAMDDAKVPAPYAPDPTGFDIDMARPALAGGAAVRFRDVDITTAQLEGQRVFFATDKERDPIQRKHRHGTFFEPEELQLMRAHLPPGGVFADIGANVGNHSLFAGLCLGASRIIPFEPNPLAYRLLVLNVLLNGLEDRVALDVIGVGASDEAADGFAMTERHKNLGAARMVAGEGDISTVRPDDVLRDETPDFVKIDVEGMEMSVLRGLEDTVARCRPVILIEVDNDNAVVFDDWRLAHRYKITSEIKHYAANVNYLLLPEERAE